MRTIELKRLISTVMLCVCALVVGTNLVQAQCPEITIDEKYDHVPSAICRSHNWDTLVNCLNASLILHATPFITTQHFNGQYLIESIPYNPVDSTFHAGSHLNISTDDAWENASISFPFTFMFFGYPYTSAVVGSNGLVSFDLTRVGQHCPYSYSVPIPAPGWPTSSDPAMNAIYGVYEDIDPAYLQSTNGTCGMFRSVGGEYPCRYLCASVNGVDQFGNHNHYNTYQIVCYEGTNIIEVHVKERNCCATTNSGKGIIGIQNATGTTQVSNYHDASWLNDPTWYIQPDSPGAFVAPDRGNQSGGWTTSTSYEAWRFTPQGETAKNISWWRLFEDADGNIIDSVEFTSDHGDTNGYYLNTEHTMVSVTPTRTTRYVVKCIYRGANGYIYGVDNRSMRDTITVGMDTARTMSLFTDDSIICEGERTSISLRYPTSEQVLDSCGWSAKKEFNNVLTDMPRSALTSVFTTTQLNSQLGQLTQNHIDSTWIFCTASFRNGCNNYDSILIQTFPNYNYYDTAGVCRGDSYTWCNMTFTQPCDTSKHYYSVTECDSTRHLHFVVSDLSFSTDYVLDCKPHTWLNGKTYAEDNDATRNQDTVILQNEWGCDSTVTLDFTFIPMKAIIEHDPEVATIDELTIQLFDRSYGHDTHKWLLPDGTTSTLDETSIIFPLDGADTMTVKLAVHNNYGCDDTATSVIRLHKVSQFIPNAFTPDRGDNNRFAPKPQGNINEQEVWIFNRRGEQVCYFHGADGYWDGTDMQGRPCVQGTYVYVVRFHNSLQPQMTQELTGTVTLIR